jgi:hypothetical protein
MERETRDLVHAETRRRGGIEIVNDAMEPFIQGYSTLIV